MISSLRILLAVLALLAAVSAWADESAPPSALDTESSTLILEGQQLMRARKYAEAIALFDKVVAGYEDAFRGEQAKLYCARSPAESLLYLLEAANAKTSAKVVSANWAYGYFMKAYALVDLGQLPEAKALLERALALSPRNAQFLAELGNIYQTDRDWARALETYKAAESAARTSSPPTQKNFELARAWRGQGFVYVEQHRYDDAEKLYRQCLELDPADATAAAELGYVQGLRAKEAAE